MSGPIIRGAVAGGVLGAVFLILTGTDPITSIVCALAAIGLVSAIKLAVEELA